MKISYSKTALDNACRFIAANNPYLRGGALFVNKQIMHLMKRLIGTPELTSVNSFGVIVVKDVGISDTVHFEIFVDPAVGFNHEYVKTEFEDVRG